MAADSQTTIEDDNKSFEAFPRVSFDRAHSVKTTNEVPLASRLWTNADQNYRYAISARVGDHWENVMKRLDVYDEDMCKGWREDIDTLLVFAGLFSAAVTAFLIESYSWLQQSPNQDTNLILLQIIQQFQNSTSTISFDLPNTEFSVTSLAIRVNVFWFSSLALSLSCAIIGILCKQWLREFRRDAALSPKDALMLRQTRMESLQKWKVEDILSSLPLLLQSALVLFFAGILDLLWSLNTIVAAVLTLEIGVALLIVYMTTVLPSLMLMTNAKLPCAYKSPQAWIFYRVIHSFTRVFARIIHRPQFRVHLPSISRIKNWTAGDRLCDRFSDTHSQSEGCLGAAMHWVYSEYRDNVSMTPHIFYCLEELSEETLTAVLGKNNLKSRYYLYCDLIQNLPRSQDRQKFAVELLLRDINGDTTSQAQQSLYISQLVSALRFGSAIDADEELLLQIIHTIRHFVQCSFDGSVLNYQHILDVSYIFLYCWRDGSDDVRRYSLLCLDDIERCIERLADRATRARLGCDFAWLMYRSAETNASSSQAFYDPLICSERFLLFVRFLDQHNPGNDMLDSSDPILYAWKQQKVSLAIQGGLPASYFELYSGSDTSDTTLDRSDSQ